ncbi:DUF1990 family protein [Deinococcus aerophilus]|uniref:DUF1990 domain-containing protein n=1 Tax=Deinococcus aerophilus TaxID=522488 RepID=A0ABQ2H1G7_9DEIO|nr:DUF1990 family protein [Deinococcus aerophilus]GGM22054.1 hypothetical protein GCM10010841_32390 [Deinococcus aerophilus]
MSPRFSLLWALPVVTAALILKGPRHPLRPSTPQDGVGPLTRRRYWVEIEACTREPEEIAEHWRTHLPDHVPRWLAWFRGLDHPVPPLRQGDRLWILMFLIRRGRVMIEHTDSLGFRARTLQLHPEAGTTDFRVLPGQTPGRVLLQIESLFRSHSHIDRLAYILGVHAAQRRTWELTLLSVARYAGGRMVDHGTETLETSGL